MSVQFRASLSAFVALWLATVAAPAATPILPNLTYLGGNGVDHVNAVAADPAGNIVVAGYTTSTNFPGAPGTLPAGASIFVTKLSANAKSLLFTTILGSDNVPSSIAVNGYDYVTSLAVDTDGSIFVAGSTDASSFPVSANAWATRHGGFIAKLDSAGRVVYATFLPYQMLVKRIRLRNGVLYAAGSFGDASFLGTAGAAQRDFAGGYSDLFVLAMKGDGSGPLYLTAVGSPGSEIFYDFVLDAAGGVILSGSSDSPAFPVTPDAFYPANADPGQYSGVLMRLDPTLAHVTYATWLPGPGGMLATTSDGNYVFASPSLDLTFTGTPLQTITLSPDAVPAFISKISSASNRPIWSTALRINNGTSFPGIIADAQGNLIWTSFYGGFSGGAIGRTGGAALAELSADGSRLLYGSPFPANNVMIAPEPSGTILVAGYSLFVMPTTADAFQPQPDPAPPGDYVKPLNYDDGFAGRVDLSSFAAGNFFVTPKDLSVTWRIGEPAPPPTVIPIQFAGNPAAALSVTPSSRLTATYAAGASPAVSVNADLAQTAAGVFTESVTLLLAGNPNTAVAVPIALTVRPAVSFDLSTTQVDIHVRQGQDVSPVNVGITTHFGNEYFYFVVDSSDRSWLSGYVDPSSGNQLVIRTGSKPPGAYTGNLTLSVGGLQNAKRTVTVRYTVDPPATIQLSTYHLALHVIKGQPFQPVAIDVMGSVPGVKFDLFVGTSYSWISMKQTAPVTPAQIIISADTSAASPGYTGWRFLVTGEDGVQQVVNYELDVSTGAALDINPAAIDLEWLRALPVPSPPFISFTTAAPGTVQWSADQPWVNPRRGSGAAPLGASLAFDTTLPEGVYQATLIATAAGASKTLPITWRLYDTPRLAFSATQLSFRYRIGDPLPPAQSIRITTPTLKQPYISVGYMPSSFVKVDPQYGTTPVTFNVTIDPAGLSAGTYTTSISFYPQFPGMLQSTQIPITLVVDPDPNAPNATVTRVTDAASYLPGSVAPGELLVIFGSGLGPDKLIQAQPGSDGRFPISLAGTTAYFGAIAAPILYASATQLAVVAPFGINGKTALTVDLSGKRTPPMTLSVSATNPGLFTANASGSGLVAGLNVAADNSVTVHGADAPISRGGILTLYGTGFGATTPIVADGVLVTAPLPVLNSQVRVLVSGQEAPLLYAGPAPGMIAGVTQINVRVPDTAASGLNSILIVAGDNSSQPGVTIAVK